MMPQFLAEQDRYRHFLVVGDYDREQKKRVMDICFDKKDDGRIWELSSPLLLLNRHR